MKNNWKFLNHSAIHYTNYDGVQIQSYKFMKQP